MNILIIASSDNSHAISIAQMVERAGHKCVFLNTLYPEKSSVSIRDDCLFVDGTKCTIGFCHNAKIDGKKSNLSFLDDFDRQLYCSEWNQVLLNLGSVASLTLFNRPFAGKSRSLIRQQRIAQSLGLTTPKTIFTNSYNDLCNYFGDKRRCCIIKPGNLDQCESSTNRVLANKVQIEDIDADTLNNAPCFFQEYIEKKYELRIYVIKRRIVACKIHSQMSKISEVDWRRYDIANTPYTPTEISLNLSIKLQQVISELDLCYGAVDVIVTPNDENVFLECNSNPSWLWIEKLTGLEISKAIVEEMCLFC